MVPLSELVTAAKEVREQAYAPYSGFKVGAALLSREGHIFTGCNVENSSYGDTICAERTALVKAISQGEREFLAIAIIADTAEPCPPCGSCRQVLAEFSPKLKVIMANMLGNTVETSMDKLLPAAFSLE